MVFKKGNISWNKGLISVKTNKKGYEHSVEARKRMSEAHKGKPAWNKGLTKETDTRVRTSANNMKGRTVWNKGLTKNTDERIKIVSNNKCGQKRTEETKKLMSDSRNKGLKAGRIITCKYWKGKKFTKEHIKKILHKRKMSSLEIKFNNIVIELNLPYKFVGNGKFFIERKNPDFINTNGEKIAIEVFYRKHKCIFYDRKINKKIDYSMLEKWKKSRTEIFERNGWKIIFLDETQVNKEYIRGISGGKNFK